MTTMQYASPTQPRKSAGVGFLLGFFFGPFGMFYVSVAAGLISVGIYIPFVFLTGGFGIFGWFLFGFLAMALASGKNNTAI